MNNFEYIRTPRKLLFKEGQEDLHQHTIFGAMGAKSFYDSISQCNKCAFCSRVCPAQLLHDSEAQGPRARNMLLRFIMDGKISFDKNNFSAVTRGCLLCGLCTKECFAKIPTHEHILELERSKDGRKLPFSYRAKRFIKTLTPFSLKRKVKTLLPVSAECFYLPSFEAKYVNPECGFNIYQNISNVFGSTSILWADSGMEKYIYSTLPKCRAAAQKLIEEYFARNPQGNKKIIVDSLEVYNFVQKSPQLFCGFDDVKAKKFAANTVFITDALQNIPAKKLEAQKVVLSKTSLFKVEENIFASAQELAKSAAGNSFCEVWDGQFYPVPLAGYAEMEPKASKIYQRKKVEFLAFSRADVVLCMSLMQRDYLNKALKNYYPKCKALYIGDLYAGK